MGKQNKTVPKNRKKKVPRPNRRVAIPTPTTNSRVAPKRAMRMSHHKTVCSITDPFCVDARGAQRQDGGPPSMPFQIRQLILINADGTTGTTRVALVPGVLYCSLGYTTVTNNWNASAFLNGISQSFPSSFMKEARIVSFGCIVRSAMTATTAKGSVILSVDAQPTVGATQLGKSSLSGADTVVIPLAAGTEYAWVSKPLGPSAHLFRPASSFTSTMVDFDWSSLILEVVGGDLSSGINYCTVEYVCNIEMTMQAGDNATSGGAAQLQRTPAPPNRVALAAADHVHNAAPSFIEGGITRATAALERWASNALDSVISDGLALLTL